MNTKPSYRTKPIAISVTLIAAALLAGALLFDAPGAGTSGAAAGPPDASGNMQPVSLALQQPIYAVADAYISQSEANQNYGQQANLVVGGAEGSRQWILVRFDLSAIPPGSTVTSAYLDLYGVLPNVSAENGGTGPAAASTFAVAAHRVLGSWSETGVTWNNKPQTTWQGMTRSPLLSPAGRVGR